MTTDEQRLIDEEHLRLLRISYFIAAGWNLFWVFFPLIYVGIGVVMALSMPRAPHSAEPDPRFIGYMFAIIGGVMSAVMTALAVMKFLTARALGRRRSRLLCLVTAGISCFAIPYGAALGVATFLVLLRPSVVEMFSTNASITSAPVGNDDATS